MVPMGAQKVRCAHMVPPVAHMSFGVHGVLRCARCPPMLGSGGRAHRSTRAHIWGTMGAHLTLRAPMFLCAPMGGTMCGTGAQKSQTSAHDVDTPPCAPRNSMCGTHPCLSRPALIIRYRPFTPGSVPSLSRGIPRRRRPSRSHRSNLHPHG
jgi:hypothetical protein